LEHRDFGRPDIRIEGRLPFQHLAAEIGCGDDTQILGDLEPGFSFELATSTAG
jgi:hypothetical protein